MRSFRKGLARPHCDSRKRRQECLHLTLGFLTVENTRKLGYLKKFLSTLLIHMKKNNKLTQVIRYLWSSYYDRLEVRTNTESVVTLKAYMSRTKETVKFDHDRWARSQSEDNKYHRCNTAFSHQFSPVQCSLTLFFSASFLRNYDRFK